MKRSKFSLSHYNLTSLNMGLLYPVAAFEALPGDTMQAATTGMVRFSPMVHPPMHPVHVRFHWWFVPNRLLWSNWEDFITGGPDGDNASVPPYFDTIVGQGTLHDYLGCPLSSGSYQFSALFARAYAKIWNEWYRDQDLQSELPLSLSDGLDSTTNQVVQRVAWEKDYFTTSRPWAQKGSGISIPVNMTDTLDVDGKSADITLNNLADSTARPLGTYNQALAGSRVGLVTQPSADGFARWVDPALEVDLANASADIDISQLREALALQRYAEARSRYGSRYTEYLRYLGVSSSDSRLQRPEYLGGGKQTMQFSEILQTAPNTDTGTSEDDGVGSIKGHGIGAARSNRWRRFFEEHGVVMCLMSIVPKTVYAQGLPRQFSRTTKEDYWQKELQFVGQQEVKKKEIYVGSAQPEEPFGYQDRYDEYRRLQSMVTSQFRPGEAQADWTFAIDYSSEPTLNGDFVECAPTDRPFAVRGPSLEQCQVMCFHSIQARRLITPNPTPKTF